jgi:hypothetical protein
MATPQWKEPSNIRGSSFVGVWGFDETATPPWFMVPHRLLKRIDLDFAGGKSVKSINPRIAKATDTTFGTPSGATQTRDIEIYGKNPGRTRIEVRDPNTKALESTLEVSVKTSRTLRIGFHFVEDKAGDKTTRTPDIVEGLIDDLNGIYDRQTNITFRDGSGGDVKLDIDLNDVVIEEIDAKTKKFTGEAIILGKSIWREIFVKKRDRLADFNIYFVPTDKPINTNLNTLPYTDASGNCVIEDGREGLDMILPHAIGRMLGCPFTNDFNHIQHLMFWDDTIRRNGNFIPKHCVNIMNPSGV